MYIYIYIHTHIHIYVCKYVRTEGCYPFPHLGDLALGAATCSEAVIRILLLSMIAINMIITITITLRLLYTTAAAAATDNNNNNGDKARRVPWSVPMGRRTPHDLV